MLTSITFKLSIDLKKKKKMHLYSPTTVCVQSLYLHQPECHRNVWMLTVHLCNHTNNHTRTCARTHARTHKQTQWWVGKEIPSVCTFTPVMSVCLTFNLLVSSDLGIFLSSSTLPDLHLSEAQFAEKSVLKNTITSHNLGEIP